MFQSHDTGDGGVLHTSNQRNKAMKQEQQQQQQQQMNAQQPVDLGKQYGAIGISALAAAVTIKPKKNETVRRDRLFFESDEDQS